MPCADQVSEAQQHCNETENCFGFSFVNQTGSDGSRVRVYFKPCLPTTHRRKCDWAVTPGSEPRWSSFTKGPAETMPIIWGNQIFTDAGDPAGLVVTCHNDTSRNRADPQSQYSLTEWQALGHSVGDTVAKTPSNAELIRRARAVLGVAATGRT